MKLRFDENDTIADLMDEAECMAMLTGKTAVYLAIAEKEEGTVLIISKSPLKISAKRVKARKAQRESGAELHQWGKFRL